MPTTFVSDSFSGSAGTALASHTGGTGATWTLVSGSATAVLDGLGGVYQGTSSGGDSFWTASGTIPPGATSVTVSTTLVFDTLISGQESGIILVNSAGHGIILVVYQGSLYLQRYSGSPTTLASQSVTLTPGNSYSMSLTWNIETNVYTGVLGTTTINSSPDATYTPTAAGLVFYNSVGTTTTGQHQTAFLATAVVGSPATAYTLTESASSGQVGATDQHDVDHEWDDQRHGGRHPLAVGCRAVHARERHDRHMDIGVGLRADGDPDPVRLGGVYHHAEQ